MNAHSFRPIFSRQNAAPFAFFFLLIIVIVFGVTAVTEQSAAMEGAVSQLAQDIPGPTGEDIKKEFNDEDLKVKGEKPRGKWGFSTAFDMSQALSDSTPVAVVGIQSLSGGGKYLGITKIKRVKVNNRSAKIVNSVQLRWTLARLGEPEKVLSEGTTPFANIWVEANTFKVVEIPTLYPAPLLKSLAKDGELGGEFQLTIGVQEARFADGSLWRRQEPAAYLKFLDPYRALDGRFPALASLAPGIVPPRSGTSGEQISTSQCALESRSTASTFFLAAVQTSSCSNDRAVFEDGEGRRSCGATALNLSCYSVCNDGFCNTWTELGQCRANPTPTPTPRSVERRPARSSPPHAAHRCPSQSAPRHSLAIGTVVPLTAIRTLNSSTAVTA